MKANLYKTETKHEFSYCFSGTKRRLFLLILCMAFAYFVLCLSLPLREYGTYALTNVGALGERISSHLISSLAWKNNQCRNTREGFMKNINMGSIGVMYYELNNETYLAGNESFFQEKRHVNNTLNYHFLIDGEDVCKEQNVFMLFLIPSVVNDIHLRNVIRMTWLWGAEKRTWPNADINVVVKHVFMFGTHSKQGDDEYETLKAESFIYHDIVMADFEDSYRNLTIKVLTGFKWASTFCSQAKFVCKVDTDTFVNVPLLLGLIDKVLECNNETDKFVLGQRHTFEKPPAVRDGQWAVSHEEYPLPFYPGYMLGHVYAMPLPTAQRLLSASRRVTHIAPEDAFITGILPRSANITRLSAPSFAMCCPERTDCEIVWNQRVAMTDVGTITSHSALWNSIQYQTCEEHKSFPRE